MKTIFTGEVRTAFIKGASGDNKIIIDDKCAEDNVVFYRNAFGVLVRIDTGTVYFTRNGAYGYLYDTIKDLGTDCATILTCPFVNKETLTPQRISKEEFKRLKLIKKRNE